jgi:preprotein translocase subunit SecG|tara:strand:+ start:22995 stop:23369 length:375 start_codon:yes stop_codon:yes gene_type:complete
MQSILLIIHLIVAVIMIVAILMQRSEGGALGIGGGGSGGGGGFGGLLKGRSSGGSIVKFTVILGAIFFATSISLTVINTLGNKSIVDGLTEVETNNIVINDTIEDDITIDNLVKNLSPSVPISQ